VRLQAKINKVFGERRVLKLNFKPVRLRAKINKEFGERPMLTLTPQQAWLRLRGMCEPDGTRIFSVSQTGSV
jgi:hypothetical protein